MKGIIYLVVASALVAIVLPLAGCQYSTPVKNIKLVKASVMETEHPPTGVFLSFPSGPYNDTVKSFNKGEEILIYIELEGEIEAPVTFTKFAFYNKETGAEVIIELLDNLGPFEPGENHTWETQAPDEDSEYELRVYIGKRVAASALLDVN